MQYSELIIYIGTLEPRNFLYLLYFSLNINYFSHCRLIIFSVFVQYLVGNDHSTSKREFDVISKFTEFLYIYTRMVLSNVLDLA